MSGPMNARILYWGVAGAGKSTNLETIHAKLRSSNRGELRQAMTRLDPTVTYEVLPIQLGDVGGVPTEIEIVTVPDGPEQAPTRKQLLDEVNGIVLVIDSSPARVDANVAAIQELQGALESYGRSLTDLPLVVQYNKRDLVDDNAIEALHRRLDLPTSAVFEAVAVDGTGVLPTLTTVSKAVVKNLRDAHAAAAEAAPAAAPQPEPVAHLQPPMPAPADLATFGTPTPVYEPTPPLPAAGEGSLAMRERTTPADASARLLESALEAEVYSSSDDLEAADAFEQAAHTSFDQSFEQLAQEDKPNRGLSVGPDLRIVSVGTATREDERSIRVPLVLGDAEGATASLALTISLEGLLDEDEA